MNVLFFKQAASVANQETDIQSAGPFLIKRAEPSQTPQFKSSVQWSLKEKVKFWIFFNKNRDTFSRCSKRQSWGLYKNMSKFIKTRNYNQCKNYYTRIIRQFQGLDSWVQHLKENNPNFDRYYQSYLQDLQVDALASQRQMLLPSLQKKANEQKQTDICYVKPVQPVLFFTPAGSKLGGNILKIFYPDLQEEKSREQQFRQCHQLFLIWCSKVKELMSMGDQL